MAEALTAGAVLSQASRVGTQREYESVVILRPEVGKPEIAEFIARMRKVFDDRSGRLTKIDSWGIRVLAYPIKHHRKGVYLYWRYLGGSDMVAEFERLLRLSDRVIRFYTVRVDDDVSPDARPSEVTEELLDAVSEPGPDPEEVARQRAEAEAARRAAQAESASNDYDDYDDERGDDEDDADDSEE
jgi:small subunit ribosomal protein S6